MHSYSLDKCKGGMQLRKKGVISSGEGLVDLKSRRVCRRLIKKRRSGVINAKEIHGEGGGGVVNANCYWKGGGVCWIQVRLTKSNPGDRGSWRKCRVGYARGGVKKKSWRDNWGNKQGRGILRISILLVSARGGGGGDSELPKKGVGLFGMVGVGPTQIYEGIQLKYISTSLESYIEWNNTLHTCWTVYSRCKRTFHWLI